MQIKKLVLQTSYLKTLGEFYSSLLELPVKVIDEKKISMAIGSTELVFDETSVAEPFYHFAITIPANKIKQAKTWLRNKKIELLWITDYKNDIADFVGWHAKSVYFYDPAGNILELIARFDLNNKMNKIFSSKQFLSISEVGIVFPENKFDERTKDLLEQYHLSYFSKQPPLPQFRAVGDDEGLFVIVPEHRNWFPTDKPAALYPHKAEFENAGKEYSLEL